MTALDYTKYDLEPRFGSRVKLLYTVPYDVFAPIEERDPDSDSEEEDQAEDVIISYNADDINSKLLKLRKAMFMYSRYYRVFQALEGELLYLLTLEKLIQNHNLIDMAT